ncbi:MAG: OsmC family protein [Candidatus Hodarchaeota archaeon]
MSDETVERHEFHVGITWTGGKEGIITLSGKPPLPLTSPVYWEGKPDAYSPHDLFISAVSGCYITTFASMMQRMKQPLQTHEVSGHGTLQKHPKGGWLFTDIYITMEITIPKDATLSQVERAVELTKKYCHISRSIASKVHVKATIHQLDE